MSKSKLGIMNWEQIIGQEHLKNQLKQIVADQRIGQALLFVGKEGYGVFPLVLALCKEIMTEKQPNAVTKIEHFSHIDVHFSFPVYKHKDEKKTLSSSFITEFRNMALANPYFDYEDWTKELDSENKQLYISVDEIENISEKLKLKSYEGGYKILIIWQADKLRDDASNKFLKLLEEPPKDTIIILMAESQDRFLQTIISRTQVYEVPRIEDESIKQAIIERYEVDEATAEHWAYQAQGNWNNVLKLIGEDNSEKEFEDFFIKWVRDAFQVKKKPQQLREIIHWATEITEWNKEKQKHFLEYCSEIFRLALLQNYAVHSLVYKQINENFKWEAFSKYIHGANIEAILEELSNASLHLVRNGNAKIIWTDLGIKLSRYIHRSP